MLIAVRTSLHIYDVSVSAVVRTALAISIAKHKTAYSSEACSSSELK